MHLETRATVGNLSKQWDELVDAQPHPSAFLKSWWIDNTAEGELAVLCVLEDGVLVGGGAFEMDVHGQGPFKVPRVRFAGQGVLAPDHLDVISTAEQRGAVNVAVARWLWQTRAMVDLDGLQPTSLLPGLLGLTVVERTLAPYRKLEASSDPITPLGGRLRSTIKRTGKRLSNEGYETRRVTSDPDGALDRLLDLHEDRWESGTEFPKGFERFRAAAVAGHAAGDVVIHELANEEGRVIASELEVNTGTSSAFYQAGRLTDHDFRGSGSVLKAEVLRWAVGEGLTEFDLLRGDEPYKADWATDRREVLRATGAVPGTKAWAAAGAARRFEDWMGLPVAVGNKVIGEDRTARAMRKLKRSIR
jgi:hypothetical protein